MKTPILSIGFPLTIIGLLSASTQPCRRPIRGLDAISEKTYVTVFNFHGVSGQELADSVRLQLRRDSRFDVLDRLSTQEASGPVPFDVDPKKASELMRRLASHLAICGTVNTAGEARQVSVTFFQAEPEIRQWRRVFNNASERWLAKVSADIVKEIREMEDWAPPQYGDEQEPTNFGVPINAGGDFERTNIGWEKLDGVSTFIQPDSQRGGKVLVVRTDLARDSWIAYRRSILIGQAKAEPPHIPRDISYASVAGLEGIHFRSLWVKATTGKRYWLTADALMPGGKCKVFIKGFHSTPAGMDGLPESSLGSLGITAEQFAAMNARKQKTLLMNDAEDHPMRYLRECYRWYLNCRGAPGKWQHFAAPFPPRGGLPPDVQWLQIQIYACWPPGTYRFDNVNLYVDPRQTEPLPEERARTPGKGSSSSRPTHTR